MKSQIEEFPRETSDAQVLELLQVGGALPISQLVEETGVTATAVRQRLSRLMAQGLIERQSDRRSRGRPAYRYFLTEKGQRKTGSNLADLATVLWEEIRSVRDAEVRRGLMQRIATRMSDVYRDQVSGKTTVERMHEVKQLILDRNVPVSVDESGKLPVLTAHACPYPGIAETDRAICSVERLMFSDLLGADVRLSACRVDGDSMCQFEVG